MPSLAETLPNVQNKQPVEQEKLDLFAKVMEEKVVAQLAIKNRDRQEEIEKARTWYVG